VIEAMHERYEGKWFTDVAFEQYSFFYANDSLVDKQIWYEVYQFPGALAIKFDSIESRSGYLFSNDTMRMFSEGEIAVEKRRIHDLVVLTMDLYSQEPEVTIAQLEELGYDLSKFHENVWQGKEVYVVGAEEGDSNSTQFWIEKERLILLRTLRTEDENCREVVFEDYMPFGDALIEQTVLFKMNGELEMREEYFNIRPAKDVDEAIFTKQGFIDGRWSLE
jgi:hypothetical protein